MSPKAWGRDEQGPASQGLVAGIIKGQRAPCRLPLRQPPFSSPKPALLVERNQKVSEVPSGLVPSSSGGFPTPLRMVFPQTGENPVCPEGCEDARGMTPNIHP
jgi:hypothetical protein